MAEILPQGNPLAGNKWADWGGPWGAPSTNDLINFGSLLKDNWGTIKTQGPGVIKSYADELNPMNYIDMTPVKQLLPDRFNPNLPEEPEWNPGGLKFDLEMQGIPEGKSWFQRAMERLIPAASAETFLPSEPMDIPGIKMGPTQPSNPLLSFEPNPVASPPRFGHMIPDWSFEDKKVGRPPEDNFTGVQWIVPEPITPPDISEYDFSTKDFRAPSAPSGVHADSIVSSAPPQTPQVVGGEDEPTKTQSQTTASRMARAVKQRQEEGKQALANIESQSRQREFERQNAIRGLAEATAAAERQRQQQRDSAAALKSMRLAQVYQRDPWKFEDARGGRR
jgi:hypothetical protein